MTKEDAVEWLKSLNYCDGEETQEVAQAINMAIKALEQQSEDCVSRAELMKLYYESRPTLATNVYEFGEKLQALPPVTPTRKSGLHWIERFDNDNWDKWLECPHCHKDSDNAYAYCPNCGASFKEEKRGEENGSN